MLHSRSIGRDITREIRKPVALATCALFALPAFGCAYGRRNRDIDRTPELNAGVSARIVYPGQSAPVLPPSVYTPERALPGPQAPPQQGGSLGGAPSYSQTPQGASGTQTGYGVPGGGPAQAPPAYSAPAPAPGPPAEGAGRATPQPGEGQVTMIGGAHLDEKRREEVKEDPLYLKYVTLPFAVLAAPFVYAAEKLSPDEEPEPVPAVPPRLPTSPTVAQTRPSAPTDYENTMIRSLERELEQRQAAAGRAAAGRAAAGQATAGQATAGQAAPTPSGAAPSSFANELAALQRRPVAPAVPTEPAPVSSASSRPATPGIPAADPLASADGIIDRDGDGRVDHWIFREQGWIERESLDENFDGRPDRTLHYDPETHDVARVEEDGDHDGRLDAWSEFRAGELVRRRADSDGDGVVDTWTFYRDGEIARLERDTTGDGFRDRVGIYRGGQLAREEQDRNGDGQLDLATEYDGKDVRRREEDTNGDGRFDVVSHYENGRLARRELLTSEALGAPSERP